MCTEEERLRRWARTWHEAGRALSEVKRAELREYDYEAHREAIDQMLQWAFEHATPRRTSGLVEQQRILARLRRNENRDGG